MFQGWDSFFLLIGGASGALIGLLFVVVSLTGELERESRMRGASLYLSPVVFHFAMVLVISGTALAPKLPAPAIASIVGLCAAVGAIHMSYVSWGIASGRSPAPAHWSDLWCYGLGPLIGYLALGASAAAAASARLWAPDAIAGAALALLLIAVRNAWDLVTWLAPTPKSP